MDWDAIRSRIMVFLLADTLGFVLFWVNRAFGVPRGHFEEILLLTLGVANGIIIFAAIAAVILLIPVAITRTVQAWLG
ncbi:MAG: hypothetical protein KF889_03310 [Alphaproteobacteria bacterium]|nr:hypothetical protein [Alphaproteobacteria bacterium]MCW5741937.1 hypothetical protein [Alphaproteobacteria bacterium]